MSLMGAGTLVFAFAIGAATFIENDYGTSAAQLMVYKALWFELLLFYLAANLVINIFRQKMLRLEKWTSLVFHIAFLFILIGAGITRYISFEGVMHIREGSSSNTVYSEQTYLNLMVNDGDKEIISNKKVLFSSVSKPKGKIKETIGSKSVSVNVTHYIPNAEQTIADDMAGTPTISMIIAGGQGRETVFIKKNQVVNIGNFTFSFESDQDSSYVNIFESEGSLAFSSPLQISAMRMADQQFDTLAAFETHPLELRKLYNMGGFNFVINDYKQNGLITINPGSIKPTPELPDVVIAEISSGDVTEEVVLWGVKGRIGQPAIININGLEISLSYGSKIITLPFSLKLIDFQLERYPGSNSPSSYASEVTLIDKENGIEEDRRIFMNNVLNYKGYRFFQSSYDRDELGTVLSVNHDKWGTIITYLGYILLALGMIFTFFMKESRISFLSDQLELIKSSRIARTATILLLLLLPVSTTLAQPTAENIPMVDEAHARRFGKLLVQDYGGRIEPMNTLASELIRKVTGKENPFGLIPEQMLLSMMAQGESWQKIPLIKITHPQLKTILGTDGKYASFSDFYGQDGYKIQSIAEDASRKKPAYRGTLDKEVMKVDEKVNIVFMIFAADFLRIYPKPDEPDHEWTTPRAVMSEDYGDANVFVQKYLLLYMNSLTEALASNKWEDVNETLSYLEKYQAKFGEEVAPPQSKLDLEVRYNESHIFPKLSKYYGLVGFILMIILFTGVFIPNRKFKIPIITGTVILSLLFLLHTVGLGVRWYISGHAPWSNGYESMIYIAWATVLAGFLFVRKSPITLAVTAILSALILWVAGLSWLDPEITNLVPVLKSYWLTIHVSMITASYGFLALGSLLAMFNLIVFSVTTKNSRARIQPTTLEITYIIETTLQVGLFMLAIGTFLGGVWANESWGRYWGWDAKETWAFVSVLVYTFILHMRYIPSMKGMFAFNFAALIGFGSIIMTYFGVNYYLSGLHSYAAGDPVPVPTFVYYTLIVITIISTISYFRYTSIYLREPAT